MIIDYPKNVSFTCNNCGICCGDTTQKTRRILLISKDVKRITKHTLKNVSCFAQQIKGKEPYLYEMNKDPQTAKCIFHKNNQCSIYVHRPLICRFYPFQLSTEIDFYLFKVTDECPGVFCLDPQKTGKILDKNYFDDLLKLARSELRFLDDISSN